MLTAVGVILIIVGIPFIYAAITSKKKAAPSVEKLQKINSGELDDYYINETQRIRKQGGLVRQNLKEQDKKKAEAEIAKAKANSSFYIVGACVAILFGAFLIFVAATTNGSSSSSRNSRVCQSCHRTFTDSENTHSIARTNMCKNCYNNYKWGQKVLGKD